MLVQLSSKELIDTDEIAFAKQDPDSLSQTFVWLKNQEDPTPFVLSMNFAGFVERLNYASQNRGPWLVTT